MSIRLKLTIILLSLVTIPLLVVSLVTFNNYEKSLETTRLTQLQDLARFKAERIETYFAELRASIEMTQSFYNIRKNLPLLRSGKAGNPGVAAARKLLDMQLARTQKILSLADIMLATTDGMIVYTSNPDHSVFQNMHLLSELLPVSTSANKDSIFISEIFLNKLTGDRPEMFAMAPVSDLSGAPAGTIIFEIDMGPLYTLIQDTVGLGRSGEVLICKQSGDELVYLNPLRHDSTAALKRRVAFGNTIALPAQQSLRNEVGVGRSIDYRGQKVIAAWVGLPSLGWGLVAKIDSREAFAAVIHLKHVVLLILIVVLAFSVLITFSVTQSISHPILVLSKGAEIIGGGNLDHKVGTATKDEIGQLSRAFDTMTDNLKSTMASRDELNREIMERRKVEHDLVRSNKDLEQFAYVASHDLQEPLRAVAGFMGLLKNQFRESLAAEAQEYIDLSVEGAERMQTLIHDLLAFSRVGTRGAAFESIPFQDAVDTALRNLSAVISESGARITHDELPLVKADLSQMTQLMQNLMGNAIKFRGDTQPEIHIHAERKEGQWVVSVADNGIGIEPQYFEKIFLIFQRLHTRSEYKGTGIGLAICKKIVERHGGLLWVESSPGRGSVFYFTIPDKGENG